MSSDDEPPDAGAAATGLLGGPALVMLVALGLTGGIVLLILAMAPGAFGMALPGGCGGG